MRSLAALAILGIFVSVAEGAAFAPEHALQQITSPELGDLRSIAGWLRDHGKEGFVGADVADAMGIPRLESEDGVNVDEEMARLMELQNAYAANSRVISVVQELLQRLMDI